MKMSMTETGALLSSWYIKTTLCVLFLCISVSLEISLFPDYHPPHHCRFPFERRVRFSCVFLPCDNGLDFDFSFFLVSVCVCVCVCIY